MHVLVWFPWKACMYLCKQLLSVYVIEPLSCWDRIRVTRINDLFPFRTRKRWPSVTAAKVQLFGLVHVNIQEHYLSCCLVAELWPTLLWPHGLAHEAPSTVGFPGKECWSGVPFHSPGALSDPGIEPVSPALAGGFFTTESPGKPITSAGQQTQRLSVSCVLVHMHPSGAAKWEALGLS